MTKSLLMDLPVIEERKIQELGILALRRLLKNYEDDVLEYNYKSDAASIKMILDKVKSDIMPDDIISRFTQRYSLFLDDLLKGEERRLPALAPVENFLQIFLKYLEKSTN